VHTSEVNKITRQKWKQAGKLYSNVKREAYPSRCLFRFWSIISLDCRGHIQHQEMLAHRERKETRQIIQTRGITYFGLFWNDTEQVLYIKKFWLNLCGGLIFQADDINFCRCRATCRRFSCLNPLKQLHNDVWCFN
jgi:hypothetical protein